MIVSKPLAKLLLPSPRPRMFDRGGVIWKTNDAVKREALKRALARR